MDSATRRRMSEYASSASISIGAAMREVEELQAALVAEFGRGAQDDFSEDIHGLQLLKDKLFKYKLVTEPGKGTGL